MCMLGQNGNSENGMVNAFLVILNLETIFFYFYCLCHPSMNAGNKLALYEIPKCIELELEQ